MSSKELPKKESKKSDPPDLPSSPTEEKEGEQNSEQSSEQNSEQSDVLESKESEELLQSAMERKLPSRESKSQQDKLLQQHASKLYKRKQKKLKRSASATANVFINEYNLSDHPKFNRCQICNKRNTVVHVPNPSTPLIVNILCESCTRKDSIRNLDPSQLPPQISLTKLATKMHTTKQRKTQNRAKRSRFLSSFSHLIPKLFCSVCSKSEDTTKILKKPVDPLKPYRVILICQKCEYDLRTSGKPYPKPVDFWRIIGVEVPPTIPNSEPALSHIRQVTGGNLVCFSCGNPLREKKLKLAKTPNDRFYLHCEDCPPITQEQLADGLYHRYPEKLQTPSGGGV